MTRNEALNQAMDDFNAAHEAYCAGDMTTDEYCAAVAKHEAAQKLYDKLTQPIIGAA